MMSIVMIRLGDPKLAGYDNVLGLLGTLLSRSVGDAEKYRVLADEYGIAPSPQLEMGVGMLSSIDEMLREEEIERLTARVTERVTEQVIEQTTQGHIERLMAELGVTAERAREILGAPRAVDTRGLQDLLD